MKRVFEEFKTFAIRGNVIDMAVGIVVGASFTGVVNSFVKDILNPPIGLLAGRVNLANLFVPLDGGTYESLAAAREAGAVTLNYGAFLSTVLDFVIVAFAIFILVRQMNRLRAKQDAGAKEAPAPSKDIQLLTEIRDSLQGGDVSRETN